MSSAKKTRAKQQRKAVGQKASLTKNVLLPLVGFKPIELPDSTCVRLVYSDYRAVVAASNQGFYVYRANSLFDPDFSGVGGQPIGFDQWKVLYQKYRVVAVGIEVQAISNTTGGVGLLAVGPSSLSATFASAEEVAGLRHAKACIFSDATPAKISMLWHISQLYGMSDEAMLSEDGYAALVTANPASQYYVHVNTEMNSATGETMIWTRLTYYARLEIPFDTIDTVAAHGRAFALRRKPAASVLDSAGQSGQPQKPTTSAVDTSVLAPIPTTSGELGVAATRGSGGQAITSQAPLLSSSSLAMPQVPACGGVRCNQCAGASC